jgi:hypothetical protein
MDQNSEKIIAEIVEKEYFRRKQYFVNHNEDHSYQGVLVNSRIVRFHLSPEVEYRYSLNAPLASNAEFLDFILHFDVSEWGEIAEVELVKKFKEVSKEFDAECDRIRVDSRVEINYNKDLRIAHVKGATEESSRCPLIYYPLGFEAYTSSYSREGEILPEVISVIVLPEKNKGKTENQAPSC